MKMGGDVLLSVRNFIQKESIVSTQQLSREFKLDRSALQPMLDFLVQKGFISKCQEERGCQSACAQCQHQPLEYYKNLL